MRLSDLVPYDGVEISHDYGSYSLLKRRCLAIAHISCTGNLSHTSGNILPSQPFFSGRKPLNKKKKKIEGIEGLVDSLINAVLFKVHKMYLSFFEVAAKQVVSLELSSREQDPSTSSEIPR